MRWPFHRKKAEIATPPTWPPVELENLSFAIFGAASKCAAHLASITEDNGPETEGKLSNIALVLEYQGFFLNLADRTAFALYGPEGRSKLIDDLVSWQLESTMQTFFGSEWASGTEAVRKFGEGLVAGLQECHDVYGSCAEIMGPSPPWSIDRSDEANPCLLADTAVGRLSIRAAEICGKPTNPEVLFQAITTAVDEHVKMGLESLVREAGNALGLRGPKK